MVQEFHVLRCFSCETFQVQQVKKSKKWSCKVCGEKQSLKKEYGRGSGADCRRHVQKLNSLRGELLEVEQERAWVQWEKEECENDDRFGEEDVSCEQQDEVQAGSRWSKYMDQTESGLRGDEHEEEEENIYTERASKKRKRSFTIKGASNTVYEDEDTSTDGSQWRTKGLQFQAHQRGGAFRSSLAAGHSSKGVPFKITSFKTSANCASPSVSLSSEDAESSCRNAVGVCCTGSNKQPSVELTTKHDPSVPACDFFAPSSCHRSLETKLEAESSKWTRFLTSASVEEDEDDIDDYAHMRSQETPAELAHSPSAPCAVMPVPTVTQTNASHLSSKGSVCARAPFEAVLGLGNKSTRVFENLSQYMSRTTSNSSSTFVSKSAGSQSPVCLQPPPRKTPCPGLSFSSLFQTDEDFDDSF